MAARWRLPPSRFFLKNVFNSVVAFHDLSCMSCKT
jgi:hypothetical protein